MRPRALLGPGLALLGLVGLALRADKTSQERAVLVPDAGAPTIDAVASPDASGPTGPDASGGCVAPSLRLAGADDVTDLGRAGCQPQDPYLEKLRLEQPRAASCGNDEERAANPRLLEAIPPWNARTEEHVRKIRQVGMRRGRRHDAFGLVGDSMTVDHAFLKPFSPAFGERWEVSEAVLPLFAKTVGKTPEVIPFFRRTVDSFGTERAAKVGQRVGWPLLRNAKNESPLSRLTSEVSPAYAFVLFGTNDALWALDTEAALVERFRAGLVRLVETLIHDGIIPIVTTIPKHMHDRRFADCDEDPSRPSNRRFLIQGNIVNRVISEVSCDLGLPLLDLRHALDPLVNHGVSGDGVHLSVYPKGGGILNERGLSCGTNVRNLVTLLMLEKLLTLGEDGAL